MANIFVLPSLIFVLPKSIILVPTTERTSIHIP